MISVVRPARRQPDRLPKALDEVSAQGHAEAIHDVRVACRRLNELLNLMAEWLGKDRVRRSCRSLRHLRRSFRRIRDPDVLLARADAACYRAKEGGRNRVESEIPAA